MLGRVVTARDKLRKRAHDMIDAEIRYGRLPSPNTLTCTDCGETGFCYDHRDYRRPLDVQVVCKACNNRRGPGLPLPTRADNSEYKIDGAVKNALASDGEGFEPLAARLNGITEQDLGHITDVNELSAGVDLAAAERVDAIADMKRTGQFMRFGVWRAEYFKRKDPWYA